MKNLTLLFVVLSTLTPTYAEITMGDSAEWLAHESDLIIVAVPIEVENIKGPGEVVFTKTRFRIDDIIKGGASKGDLVTIFDFSYNKQDVLGLEKAQVESRQVLVYAQIAEHMFREINDKYVFTHTHEYKSAYHVGHPVTKLFTPEFKTLTSFGELLERTRTQVTYESGLKYRYWTGAITKKELEVPEGSEAFGHLYGGSVCYIVVPEYVDKMPSK